MTHFEKKVELYGKEYTLEFTLDIGNDEEVCIHSVEISDIDPETVARNYLQSAAELYVAENEERILNEYFEDCKWKNAEAYYDLYRDGNGGKW